MGRPQGGLWKDIRPNGVNDVMRGTGNAPLFAFAHAVPK
jgi:hypothetical protein